MTALSTLCYIQREGKYLMLHRTVKKNDVNKDKWIGVGGHFEADECPEECLEREVKEETGYTPGKTVHLISSYPSIGYTQEMLHIYLCTDLTPGETNWDENEMLEIYEYDFDRLMDMIARGELKDGKTQLGLLMAKQVLGL